MYALGGPIFRLKGSILCMSFLDCNGALIPYSYEPWKDEGKQKGDSKLKIILIDFYAQIYCSI